MARAETTFAGGVGAWGMSVGTRQAEGMMVSRLIEGRGARDGRREEKEPRSREVKGLRSKEEESWRLRA